MRSPYFYGFGQNYLFTPYDGELSLKLKINYSINIKLVHNYWGNEKVIHFDSNNEIVVPIKKGKNIFSVAPSQPLSSYILYTLTPNFHIYEDNHENNDTVQSAKIIVPNDQLIVGTFSHKDDYDWYEIPVEKEGNLRIRIKVDTTRLDIVMAIRKKGEEDFLIIDQSSYGESEYVTFPVTPGKYDLRISHSDGNGESMLGEYYINAKLLK